MFVLTRSPNQNVQNILRGCTGTVLTTSGVRLYDSAHLNDAHMQSREDALWWCVYWEDRQDSSCHHLLSTWTAIGS